MKKNEYLNSKVEEILSSADGIERAAPRPFLYTRIMAKMQATKESVWEKMGSLITRPSFAIAGLSAIIILNVAVITLNHTKENNINAQQSVVSTADYFSSNDIAIDNVENTTP